MIKDGVMIDTSVWIAFLRGKDKVKEPVVQLLQGNRAITTGIVIAELIQGMKDIREEDRVSDILSSIPIIELSTDMWIKAGKKALSLRRKGINLPITDVAIATLAINHNLSVFTLDRHFEKISGVELFKSL